MPVVELFDSRRSQAGASQVWEERLYVISETSDQEVARASLMTYSPAAVNILGVTTPRESIEVEVLGPWFWKGIVRYGHQGQPEEGENVFSFEISVQGERITQSLQTISKHAPAGQTAPDHKGAIGVTDDGEGRLTIEGCEMLMPTYSSSERYVFPTVTLAKRQQLFSLVGKVNNATFREYAAGECLFAGVTGSSRPNDGKWDVTFRFLGRPNRTDIDIGGVITVPAKKGWEYLWVQYADVEDGDAGRIAKRPLAAYVEKIYETANFALIGIGT